MTSIYNFTVKDNKLNSVNLKDYEGKVLLVVNTASACGLTSQYEGLQALYEKYKAQGLEILAFPCNQFKGQEPGTNEEIQTFCRLNYNVTFPIFDKIEVNGDNAHPLYKYLKEQAPGILETKAIKWNFGKFLIDSTGEQITRYAPTTPPEDLAADIEQLLS